MHRWIRAAIVCLLLASAAVAAAGSLSTPPLVAQAAWQDMGPILIYSPNTLPSVSPAPDRPFILHDTGTGTYRMWLTVTTTWDTGNGARSVNEIYYATSGDGYRWQMMGPAINMTRAPWNAYLVGAPYVLDDPGAGLNMYFLAGNNSVHPIYHAHSSGGLNWTIDSPILGPGPSGSWDDLSVSSPWVVFGSGSWYLYFVGCGSFNNTPLCGVGLALLRNLDLVDHLVGSGPILGAGPAGAWDAGGVFSFSLPPNDYQTMYYLSPAWAGGGPRVGVARSSNGQTWNRSEDDKVLPSPGYTEPLLDSVEYVPTEFGPRLYYTSIDLYPSLAGVLVPSSVEVPGPANPYYLPALVLTLAALGGIAADAVREARLLSRHKSS